MKVKVQASCCMDSASTTLGGRHSRHVNCFTCGQLYNIEYTPADDLRIPEFLNRLFLAAQEAVNANHSGGMNAVHTEFVPIEEV